MTTQSSVRTRQRQRKPSSREECLECGSTTVVTSTDGTERHCDDCGLVLDEDHIDPGPEWRVFDQSQYRNRRRVGAPRSPRKHDFGLTTEIGWRNVDGNGNRLSASKRHRLDRLRTWQERIRTSQANERSLQFALSEIERMAATLEIPKSYREPAARLFRRALQVDLVRGRSIEAIASVCLYIATRHHGIPRSIREIAHVSHVDRKEISRAHLYLVRELDLELVPVDPADYVPRFCSILDVDDAVGRMAIRIIRATADDLLVGNSPTGFAAGAIYAASLFCDDKRPQREVADVAKVTEITVRKHYQAQLDALDHRPPSD